MGLKQNCLLLLTFLLTLVFFQTVIFSKNHLHYKTPRPDHHNFAERTIQDDLTIENLAEFYFHHTNNLPKNINSSCARFPDLFDIRFHNDHWQVQKTPDGTFHLFSAYVDNRFNSVRILGTFDLFPINFTFFCQFWYVEEKAPLVVSTEIPQRMFVKGWGGDRPGLHQPYLFTCPLVQLEGKNPISVSMVQESCDNPTNNVKINWKKVEKKKDFLVCVKGLSFYYDDNSVRMAEWIELIRLLGGEKINFYKFGVDDRTDQVLKYYESQGFVEITPMSLVGDYSNNPVLQDAFLRRKTIQRRLQEVIPYNDCLYKHLDEFKYVVLLDTDEIIVPKWKTWRELLSSIDVEKENFTNFMARNVYFFDTPEHQHEFFDEVPRSLYMLQHIFRSETYSKRGKFTKGFHKTDFVVTLHNHYPFACSPKCRHFEIDTDLAQLQHYRVGCPKEINTTGCELLMQTVTDHRIWHFKDELVASVNETLRALNIDFY